MQAVLDQARRYARSDASILITGESGTGKEVMARLVHRESRRAAGPFVTVNCAALPEPLLEAELFGHERGAFTGAHTRRAGKFEQADGGTLLLDEVAEMAPSLQAKLLRALQEREIDRLGGAGPIAVDVRILATTNRDLEAAVLAGQFREDLFFRLNVVRLMLPPLRERQRDIPALAVHFAGRSAAASRLPEPAITPAAMVRLCRHRWRGNIRELANCLQRAVLDAGAGPIDGTALGLPPEPPATGCDPRRPSDLAASAMAGLVGHTVDELERRLIVATLAAQQGNRTRAAPMLGISLRTLRNKLHAYARTGATAVAGDGPAASVELGRVFTQAETRFATRPKADAPRKRRRSAGP